MRGFFWCGASREPSSVELGWCRSVCSARMLSSLWAGGLVFLCGQVVDRHEAVGVCVASGLRCGVGLGTLW